MTVTTPPFIPYMITQTPFLYPPPGFVLHQAIENPTLPDMALMTPIYI